MEVAAHAVSRPSRPWPGEEMRAWIAHARRLHPPMRRTDTYNAVANTHMIAINETMGFRPMDRLIEYQLSCEPPRSSEVGSRGHTWRRVTTRDDHRGRP